MRYAMWMAAVCLALTGCSKTTEDPNAGGAEAPKAEAPKADAPKADAPKADVPEADAPKADAPEADAPKADAPTPAPSGTVPTLLADLSAEHTVAAGGIEGLDGLFTEASEWMKRLPPKLTEEMPGGFDALIEKMGFDARTTEGWAAAGIDPIAGLAAVLDSRLKEKAGGPLPVVLARVTDRGKLLETLKKIDPAFELTLPEADGIARLDGPGGQALVGQRGTTTAVLLVQKADEMVENRAAFAAWLKAKDAPLSGVDSLAPSLKMPGTSRSWGIAFTKPALALIPQNIAPVFADFYSARFPALSFSAGTDLKSGRMRIQGDPAAVAALRQILIPPGKAPALRRHRDEAGVTFAMTIDLIDLFDGIVALIPPERGDLQGQVLIGKNAVPLGAGVSLEDIGKAFSGHMMIFVDPQSVIRPVGPPAIVVALGVGDVETADRVLATVLDRVAQQAGQVREPTKFGALEGHIIKTDGPPTFVVRAGFAVLAGPSRAAIEAAIARGEQPVKPAPALDLNDGTFYAISVPISLLDAAVADAPEEQKAFIEAVKAWWTSQLGDGLNMALKVDDHGVVSPGSTGAMTVGVMAAVAIPAFVKYINKSKAVQARLSLNQLFVAATLAMMEEKPLTEVPLTPAVDPCADGGDGSYEATAATWAHPTWQALGFTPTGKHYYRYALKPTGGQGFTVRAIGDLDCDGVRSTYEYGNDAEGQRLADKEIEPLE